MVLDGTVNGWLLFAWSCCSWLAGTWLCGEQVREVAVGLFCILCISRSCCSINTFIIGDALKHICYIHTWDAIELLLHKQPISFFSSLHCCFKALCFLSENPTSYKSLILISNMYWFVPMQLLPLIWPVISIISMILTLIKLKCVLPQRPVFSVQAIYVLSILST